MNSRIAVLVCISLLAANASSTARAAEDKGFKNTLALGVSLTDGNTETTTANVTLISEGEQAGRLGSVRIGLEVNYGENTVAGVSDTTTDNAKGFANVKKTFNSKFFAYLDTSLFYDDIALVDYRALMGPGVGLHLVKSDTTKLFVEVGSSYVWEEVAEISDDYVSLRLAQRFEHKLSESAKVWQSVEYLPEAEALNNYLLNAEVGAEAALNSRMNLRLVLQDRYDSEPAPLLEENDLTFLAGLGIKL